MNEVNLDLIASGLGTGAFSRGIQGVGQEGGQGGFLAIIANMVAAMEENSGNLQSETENNPMLEIFKTMNINSSLDGKGTIDNAMGLDELDLENEKKKLLENLMNMFPYGNPYLTQISEILLGENSSENIQQDKTKAPETLTDTVKIADEKVLLKPDMTTEIRSEELKTQTLDLKTLGNNRSFVKEEFLTKSEKLNFDNVGKLETAHNSKPIDANFKTEDAKNPLELQRDMALSLRQAKASMKGENLGTIKPKEEFNINAEATIRPQASVEVPGEVVKTDETMAKFDVANQIEDKILENINSKDDKTFTMKLRPADLGEITVKLEKVEGRVVVEIVTALTETSKVINEQMAALKQALVPLNAEIKEATVQPTSGSEVMEQFNMSGDGFANQQFANQQFNSHRGTFSENRSYDVGNDEVDGQVEEARNNQTLNQGVNMYI